MNDQTTQLTFEGLTTRLLEEILLVAVVRNVSHTHTLDLPRRKDVEFAMLSFELTIVVCLVWWIVDMANNLGTFGEDWGIFGQLLSLRNDSRSWVVVRG